MVVSAGSKYVGTSIVCTAHVTCPSGALAILDGGYLALIGWQAITRREVDLRKLAPIAAVAVSLLFVFVLVVVWLDITNPIANPFR